MDPELEGRVNVSLNSSICVNFFEELSHEDLNSDKSNYFEAFYVDRSGHEPNVYGD